MDNLIDVLIIALACPLLLPLVIEYEETEPKGENNDIHILSDKGF